jgi:hypothetical protein
MASPYQQQAFQRKLIYLGCILVLFTGAWVWRQYILVDEAKDLGVREVNRGDVELSGQVVRLSLLGLRGVATCVLWMTALDDQKKNEWNKLEQDATMMTQMQPHFITPWEFQSWNLSYNVSVELDRSSDKYFYIGRGIELLAKGERQNRYNPKIRWDIGFTYQMKICQHDETNVLRSLFQLSCIPPNKRDPNRLLERGPDNRPQINWKEFIAFCKENPQLIRRLNSGIQREDSRAITNQFRCQTPESLVQFLADNYKILSPYETPPAAPLGGWVAKEDRLKDEQERFPSLPPAVTPGRDPRPGPMFDREALTSNSTLNDSDDAYEVARAWYGYAMEPLPPPGELPGENTEVKDRLHQRIPNSMTTSIFRQYPARAASYMAERLQQEGWFDDEPWPIPGWFRTRGDKFVVEENPTSEQIEKAEKAEVRVQTGHESGAAWATAFRMWRQHGVDNHMLFDPEEARVNKQQLADEFQKLYGLPKGAMAPNLRKEDVSEEVWEQYTAYRYMRGFELHSSITNFRHHYLRAQVEQDPDTVQARKRFYKADSLRIKASTREAVKMYEQPEAMPMWRKILLKPGNEEFRKDSLIQEDTAEVQLKYFDLVNVEEGLKMKAEEATKMPSAFPLPIKITQERTPKSLSPRSLIKSPFLDEKGQPIIPQQIMEQVEQRRVKPGQKPQSKPVEKEPEPTAPQPPK